MDKGKKENPITIILINFLRIIIVIVELRLLT
jgi:hypothetical protein